MGIPQRRVSLVQSGAFILLSYSISRLQTPVYALYPVPTIVCAAILLATRHLRIPLPSQPPNCWWILFDAEWEDVWSVAGHIMQLYRQRSEEDATRPMSLLSKKDVRRWLDKQRDNCLGVTRMSDMNICASSSFSWFIDLNVS